jgi:muramoyltetrapeptide carboxypeptidase
VVAPSGPVSAERFDRGLKVLRRTLEAEVVVSASVHEQQGYLAGSDASRLDAMRIALADPDATAIVCARGGYGATRLLPMLDPELLRRHPKLLMGFSDITALLCWAWMRGGLTSVHGPVVTQLSRLGHEDTMRLGDMLTGQLPAPISAEEGTCIHGGQVEGRLVVGNLEVLRSLVGTRYLPPFAGAILAIEEVGERPYRIDRALTQLIQAGAFRGVRGVVVGQFLRCEEPDWGTPDCPTAHDVLVERLEPLGIPVVTGFPFGHDDHRNAALPFGGLVRLDADNCTLSMLEPATAP